MAQEKKSLKETDPKKYHTRVKNACLAGKWVSALAPLAIVFGAKWNEYLEIAGQESGGDIKLTIGGILAIIVAVIVVYKNIQHQEKVNEKTTMLSWTVGVGVALVLSYLLSVVFQDLTLILASEFVGSVVAYGLDMKVQSEAKFLSVFTDESTRIEARKMANPEHTSSEVYE